MSQQRTHPSDLVQEGHHFLKQMCLAALLSLVAGDFAQAQAQNQGSRRPAPPPKPVCLVADFRTLALDTHDPRERFTKVRDWLRANGSACTAAQLGVLASNRAAWLGNADTPALMGMVDGMIETLEAKQALTAAASSVKTAANAPATPPATETVTAGTPPPRTAAAPNPAAAAPAIAPVVVPVAVPAAAPPAR